MITFEKCQRPELKGDVNTDIDRLVDRFLKSGEGYVKLKGWHHKNAKSCANSINAYIRNGKIAGVRVATKNGEVYLINTLKENKKG